MKGFITIISIFILSAVLVPADIIIRHDIPDEKYIEFAKELPVTSSIVHYNSTDLAGTLITPQWVLSAAHVAETIKDDHKLIVNGDSVGIGTIIIHPGWEANGRPDLALIKLDQKITGVKPVQLYHEKDEIGKKVVVAGHGNFGTGKTGVEGKPGTMRAATNKVDGSTSDSAGPAFIKINEKYYLAGTGSAQSTQATGGVEGLYGVTEYYVRVSTFVGWIEEEIGVN